MKFVGLNGSIVEAARAEVSVLDHGLLYGMGAFETFRTYNGKPFLLERHLNRLAESCSWMGIEFQADPKFIRGWITGLMHANGLADAYIRYTITAGEAPLGLPSGDYVKPAQILFAKALPGTNASLYEKGRALRLLSLPRNTPESPVRMKSLHYMNNILAKRELDRYPAHPDGPAEGLLLTAAGELAEGIVSNVFFVKDGRLYTPDLGTGILPGITRAVVMELAAGAGIRTEEGRYRWQDLLEADEIFTTGSIQEIVPVTTLIGLDDVHQVVGAGTAGPITWTLLGAYREKAGLHQ